MLKNTDPLETYRKELDGKTVSSKESGGDYEFQFSRPLNRQGEIFIKRISTGEKFESTFTLKMIESECQMSLNLTSLPDDLKLEFDKLRELEYSKFLDALLFV